jgi:hypothetical protein
VVAVSFAFPESALRPLVPSESNGVESNGVASLHFTFRPAPRIPHHPNVNYLDANPLLPHELELELGMGIREI